MRSAVGRAGRWLIIGLAVVAACPARSWAAVLGDVDGDGRVTVLDAVAALRMAALGEGPAESWIRADVWPAPGSGGRRFGDGQVTADDARAILGLVVAGARIEVGRLVATVAGDGISGTLAAPTRLALDDPYDVAVAPDGDLYIAESSGQQICRLTPNGRLEPFCGSGRRGYRDGGSRAACFNGPYSIDFGPDGALYVADRFNHSIRRIGPGGVVDTIAGTGRPGYRDGPGAVAQFSEPQGLRVDSNGAVWVADTGNHRIRRIGTDGVVTTVAGDGQPGLVDGPALQARFSSPSGVYPDPVDGSLWIADTYNHAIRRWLPDGTVVTAGGNGQPGFQDGPLRDSRFFRPFGFARDRRGNLYVADWGNAAVRRIDPAGWVETVAGNGTEGHRDGPALTAQLHGLMNLAVAPDGVLYLADTDNESIRAVLP